MMAEVASQLSVRFVHAREHHRLKRFLRVGLCKRYCSCRRHLHVRCELVGRRGAELQDARECEAGERGPRKRAEADRTRCQVDTD